MPESDGRQQLEFASATMEKKIVIKLKYGTSAGLTVKPEVADLPPEYDWHYKRIAMAVVVLTLLAFAALWDGTEKSGAGGSVLKFPETSQSSFPVTAKTIDTVSVEGGAPSGDVVETSRAEVVRAGFAWGIHDREPTGVVNSPAILQPGHTVAVHFFSEFRGMDGETVSHQWSLNGQVVFVRNFRLRPGRRGVFSSRQLDSGTLGTWSVSIRDSERQTIGEYSLEVLEPGQRNF
ncbi:MAG: DUF2914 domain-containing protein [Methylococcales bacterium]|nr:DUF2914 domain-containing protein [Methylococcales bacterium]